MCVYTHTHRERIHNASFYHEIDIPLCQKWKTFWVLSLTEVEDTCFIYFIYLFFFQNQVNICSGFLHTQLSRAHLNPIFFSLSASLHTPNPITLWTGADFSPVLQTEFQAYLYITNIWSKCSAKHGNKRTTYSPSLSFSPWKSGRNFEVRAFS